MKELLKNLDRLVNELDGLIKESEKMREKAIDLIVEAKKADNFEEKLSEQVENEVNQILLDEHDCHHSAGGEDGCDCDRILR